MLDHCKYRHTESFTFPFGTGIRKRESSSIFRYSSERHLAKLIIFLVKNGLFFCYLAKLYIRKLIKGCSTVVCVCMCILNPFSLESFCGAGEKKQVWEAICLFITSN